jgi:hypothetical protein
VDFDGDGFPDILSGSCSGAVFIFRGQGAGKFGPREQLKDQDGSALRVGTASTVFAADWRGTGNLDLLVGTQDGFVYLIPNEGRGRHRAFGRPYRLRANGQEIHVPSGYTHPVAADWDRDGRLDLIVGTGAGSVIWYRNVGTPGEPLLDGPRTLIAESAAADGLNAELGPGQWGTQAKICVTDWNGDGWPDLLVGDYARVYKLKPRTAAEMKEENEARAKLAQGRKDFKTLQETIRRFPAGAAGESPEAKNEREAKLQNARGRLAELAGEIEELEQTVRSPRGNPEHHGYVWLFLRKPK